MRDCDTERLGVVFKAEAAMNLSYLPTPVYCSSMYNIGLSHREFKTKNDEIQKRMNEAVQLQNSLQQVRTCPPLLSTIPHPIASYVIPSRLISAHKTTTDCTFPFLSSLFSLLSASQAHRLHSPAASHHPLQQQQPQQPPRFLKPQLLLCLPDSHQQGVHHSLLPP